MPARLALVRLRLQFEGSVQLSATVLAEETVPVGAARKITPRTAALSLACSRSLHLPTACCPLPPSTPPFLALSLHSTTRLMPLRAVLQRRTSSTIGLPDATQAMILPAQFPHVDTQSLFCCTRPLSVGCKQVSASALGVDNCSRSSKPQEQEQEEEQPQGAAAAAAAAAAAEAAAAAAAAAAGPCFVGHLLGAVRALHHLPSRLRVLRPAGRPGGEKWEQCSCHERGRTGGEQAKNSRRTGGEQAKNSRRTGDGAQHGGAREVVLPCSSPCEDVHREVGALEHLFGRDALTHRLQLGERPRALRTTEKQRVSSPRSGTLM